MVNFSIEHMIVATVWGVVAPLCLILLHNSLIPSTRLNELSYEIIMAGTVLYLFFVLKAMLETRFNFQQMQWPFSILAGGLVLHLGAALTAWLGFGHHPQGPLHDANFFATATTVEIFLKGLDFSAIIIIGASLFWLRFVLSRMPDSLYGLSKPLQYSILGGGGFVGMFILGLYWFNPILLHLSSVLILMMTIITFGLIALICLRALYQQPAQQWQYKG